MKKILIVLTIAVSGFFSTAFAIQQEMKIAFTPYETWSAPPVSFDLYSHTFPVDSGNWVLKNYKYVDQPGIGFDIVQYDNNTTYFPANVYFADGTKLRINLMDGLDEYTDPNFNIIVVECQYTAPGSNNRNAFCTISGKGK